MNRTKSLMSKIILLGICAAALSACYYGPAYGPGYYGPPPVTGAVVVDGGGGWHNHWR
jgi:hypothetical protein